MVALRGEAVWPVRLDGTTATAGQQMLHSTYGRIRTAAAAPDGRLRITTSNRDGRGHPKAGDRQDRCDLGSVTAVVVRLAMWSGPRNVSTALMRSFGSRADTFVVDEPLYAAYLATTGIEHPGRDEVLASQPTDWRDVARSLTGPLPPGVAVHYQKHMAHHLLPGTGRDWLGDLTHAYLIRDPEQVVASYAKVRGEPTLADLGYPQQVEIFRRHGGPVVDAGDLLRDPARVLAALCAGVGIGYDPAMLSWEPGRRETDGVWAPWWYAGVEASTGFGPPDTRPAVVPQRLVGLVDAARPYYDELAPHRLTG